LRKIQRETQHGFFLLFAMTLARIFFLGAKKKKEERKAMFFYVLLCILFMVAVFLLIFVLDVFDI
jgi:hypothetical protein